MATAAQLHQKAIDFQKLIRAKLQNMAFTPGQSSWGQGGAAQHDDAMRRYYYQRSGMAAAMGDPNAQSIQRFGLPIYGNQAVSDKNVRDYIDNILGGNPYLQQLKNADAKQNRASNPERVRGKYERQAMEIMNPRREADLRKGKSATDPAESDPNELMRRLFDSFQGKMDEANAANEGRYQEGKTLLEDLISRNNGRVDTFGEGMRQDIQDAAEQNLGDIKAQLAARGLANSNILPAFMARNERDKGRELRRVDEMANRYASDMDTRNTSMLADWIERRTDAAPDFGMLAQLAMQYGQSGAGQGKLQDSIDNLLAEVRKNQATPQQAQQRPAAIPQYQQSLPPAVYAPRAPLGNFNPVGMANSMLGNLMSQQAAYNLSARPGAAMVESRYRQPQQQPAGPTTQQWGNLLGPMLPKPAEQPMDSSPTTGAWGRLLGGPVERIAANPSQGQPPARLSNPTAGEFGNLLGQFPIFQ